MLETTNWLCDTCKTSVVLTCETRNYKFYKSIGRTAICDTCLEKSKQKKSK